jgi:hypothetical protein
MGQLMDDNDSQSTSGFPSLQNQQPQFIANNNNLNQSNANSQQPALSHSGSHPALPYTRSKAKNNPADLEALHVLVVNAADEDLMNAAYTRLRKAVNARPKAEDKPIESVQRVVENNDVKDAKKE